MGTGSIELLKGGSYRVSVYAGKDPITGRKRYLKESHPTREAAVAARDRLLVQVEADTVPDRAATLAVLLDRWLEVAELELSTRETSAGYIRRTLKPALGDVSLRKLQHRVDLLDRLYTHLRRCNVLCDGRAYVVHTTSSAHDCTSAGCQPHECKPMAPATVRRIHAILSTALGYAVSWGWIERNPAEYAHPPKLQRRRARPPEAEQVARLLNLAFEVDLEMGVFLWLATTTGARRGELVALRWSAVNLGLAYLDIAHNYVVRDGQRRLKGTKTDTERRLSLDELTVEMLRDFRAQREAAVLPGRVSLANDAFLFSADPRCARPWHPDHFTHLYRDLAQTIGVDEPLKNLRHFNATQLLAAGVDLRTTAGRLGHGDGGATTLRVYASWTRRTDDAAVQRLAEDLSLLRSASARGHEQGGGSPGKLPRTAVSSDLLLPSAGEVRDFRGVVLALEQAVDRGRLRGGDRLPTLRVLASAFDVSISTVQRGVLEAADRGKLRRVGAGWVVM